MKGTQQAWKLFLFLQLVSFLLLFIWCSMSVNFGRCRAEEEIQYNHTIKWINYIIKQRWVLGHNPPYCVIITKPWLYIRQRQCKSIVSKEEVADISSVSITKRESLRRTNHHHHHLHLALCPPPEGGKHYTAWVYYSPFVTAVLCSHSSLCKPLPRLRTFRPFGFIMKGGLSACSPIFTG